MAGSSYECTNLVLSCIKASHNINKKCTSTSTLLRSHISHTHYSTGNLSYLSASILKGTVPHLNITQVLPFFTHHYTLDHDSERPMDHKCSLLIDVFFHRNIFMKFKRLMVHFCFKDILKYSIYVLNFLLPFHTSLLRLSSH